MQSLIQFNTQLFFPFSQKAVAKDYVIGVLFLSTLPNKAGI